MLEVIVEEDDDRNVLIVNHNGKEILLQYDYGEPEDNSFIRDWAWVPSFIERVYNLGFKDGFKEGAAFARREMEAESVNE